MDIINLPKTIFCDIDGTLIKYHGGVEKDLKDLPKPNYSVEALPGTLDKLWEWDSKGYNIILTTGRKESWRNITEQQLQEVGIVYDQLIMGLGAGARYVVNDAQPDCELETANAIVLKRDEGIGNINI